MLKLIGIGVVVGLVMWWGVWLGGGRMWLALGPAWPWVSIGMAVAMVVSSIAVVALFAAAFSGG